jgi:hypothetical protein
MKAHHSLIFYDEYSFERNAALREFVENTFVDALLESVRQQCILVL